MASFKFQHLSFHAIITLTVPIMMLQNHNAMVTINMVYG